LGDKTLGARLRARRAELGLTIAKVARRAELSMQYVANLERDRGNPTLDALSRIAEALETPLVSLLGDEGPLEEAVEALALASMPRSLVNFSRTDRFKTKIERLAAETGTNRDELRRRVLVGMSSAPRRSKGEPTAEDWSRLLDTYELIIRG
jgi:transcriptional regulator with XRE-family HTH domain